MCETRDTHLLSREVSEDQMIELIINIINTLIVKLSYSTFLSYPLTTNGRDDVFCYRPITETFRDDNRFSYHPITTL